MPLIRLGRIVRPHSRFGEIRLLPDNPESTALREKVILFLRRAGQEDRRIVAAVRRHKGFFLVKFEGVDSLSAAEELVGAEVYIEADALPPLGQGEYYHHQLVGMGVRTVAGDWIGEVAEVLPSPAADVLVIRHGKQEHLVPMVEVFVKEIKLDRREIVIEPIPGLLSE